MGKVDDMRRQREEQALQRERRAVATAPKAAVPAASVVDPVVPVAAPVAADVPREAKPRVVASKPVSADEATEGKCSGCGKLRPLQRGLVANHQKGFGKMCPGARKVPQS